MKRNVLVFSLLCGLALLGRQPTAVSAQDVLFLAHFNESVKPEVGNVKGMVARASITAGGAGYGFTDSQPRAEAANVGRSSSFLAYPATGNISMQEGTLQMMVKPQWSMKSYGHCVFFKLVFSGNKHKDGFCDFNSYYLQKSPQMQQIALVRDGNRNNFVVRTPMPPLEGGWLHLAMTWNAAAKRHSLYVNGKLAGSKPFLPMSATPREFTLGCPGTHNAQALLDEVRILRRELSADEILQDYQYLKSGHEFPGGSASSALPDMTFVPMPVKQAASGLAAQLLPIRFEAPLTKETIKLDGNLDEPAWQETAPITKLRIRGGGGKMPPPTEYRVMYSHEGLYIGVVLHHQDMSKHIARYDQHDMPVYSDECAEFFLDLAGRSEDFYQFCVNSLGSVYDSRNGDVRWTARGMKVGTRRLADRWTIEMMLPFRAFNRTAPLPGEYWGARLGREHHHGTNVVSIPQVVKGSFNQRHYLGRLVFMGGSKQGGAEVTCRQTSFSLGMNRLDLRFKGAWPKKVRLSSVYFDDNNRRLGSCDDVVTVRDLVTAHLPVKDDHVNRIVVQVLAEGKEDSLGIVILQRRFAFVSPGLWTIRREAEELLHSLGDLRRVAHPVYKGTVTSLERIIKVIKTFEQDVQQAIVAKVPVDDRRLQDVCALANGFQRFRRDNQYLCWQVSPWEVGGPQALPARAYRFCEELSYQQASNEREARCLVLSGLMSGKRLDLHLVPRSATGRDVPFLSTRHVEIYTEPFVNHLGDLITGPLLKAPGNVVTLTPGHAVRVWIVFNSRGVAPGDYDTSLDLKPLYDYSLPNKSIALKMKVWNFTLPETRDWPLDCFFWGPNVRETDEAAMLRLMHSRHVNWGWTRSMQYVEGIEQERYRHRLPTGQLFRRELVMHANQEFFDTAKELGMRFVFGWGTTESVEWHQLMADRLKAMGFTAQDFLFKAHIRDEFVKADIPPMAPRRKKFADLKNDWRYQAVYLSTPPPVGATLKDIDEAGLADFYKNWTVISGMFTNTPDKGQKLIRYFKSHGCDVWPYQCNTAMPTLSILDYYRFLPWLAKSRDLPGCAFWTCLSGDCGDDGLDNRDGYDDGITRLDSDLKPIPTKQLEAVCEGLEDVAYMAALEKQLKEKGQLLKEQRRKHLQDLITAQLPVIMESGSQDEVDAWRLEVGTAIDELSRMKK